jgi:ketosteroid isomerase-like protein
MKRAGMRAGVLLCAAFAVSAAAGRAQSSDAARQVLAVEQARVEALDHGDIPALERIMADDVRYVHASGHVDTRESYLDGIRSGQLKYIFWKPEGLHVQMLGNTAVLSGKYAVRANDLRVQKAPFDVQILVLSVYAKRGGRWQLVAYQSTNALPTK